MTFSGGRALVVGGSGGIGAAVCHALAEAGAEVTITWRDGRAAAEQTAGEIQALGHRATCLQLDLADPASVAAAVSEPLHTLVYAAGPPVDMRFVSQLEPDLLRRNLEVDVQGFHALLLGALPHLRAARGSVVAVTTAALARHVPRDILSTAPKAALEAFVRAVAVEEGRHGVRANTVAIGAIDAGMFQRLRGDSLPEAWVEAAVRNTPLGRLGTAEEVAAAVTFLASSRASFVTGQRLVVDGGFSV